MIALRFLERLPSNSIQQQIDTDTCQLAQPQLGEKKLEIVLPYAKDFLKRYTNDKQNPLELLKDPFVSWINSPPHPQFVKAYGMIKDNQINPVTNNDLKLFFDLLMIYANTICQIIGLKIRLGDKAFYAQIVPKFKDRENLHLKMQKLMGKLKLGTGGILSRQESKIHLVEKLLEDILGDDIEHNRNFFHATSTHSFVLREIMTKKFMHGLYPQFP